MTQTPEQPDFDKNNENIPQNEADEKTQSFDSPEYQERQKFLEQMESLHFPLEHPEGFAKLLRSPLIEKIIDSYSFEQQRDLAFLMMQRTEIIPPKIHLRLQLLDIIRIMAAELLAEIEDPRTLLFRAPKFADDTLSRLADSWVADILVPGKRDKSSTYNDSIWDDKFDGIKKDLKHFLENDYQTIFMRIFKEGQSFRDASKDFPFVQKFAQKLELRTDEPDSKEHVLGQYFKLVEKLYSMKHYEAASNLIEQLLERKFSGPKREQLLELYNLSENRNNDNDSLKKWNSLDKENKKTAGKISKLKSTAIKSVAPVFQANIDLMRDPSPELRAKGAKPILGNSWKKFQDALIDERFEMLLNHEIAKSMDSSDLSFQEKRLWDVYQDMHNPKKNQFMKAEEWDKIVEEIVVNLPLILVSGYVGGAVKASLSSPSKYLVGQISRRTAIKQISKASLRTGSKASYHQIAAVGGQVIENFAKRGVLSAGGAAAPGLLVEGFAFEFVHMGIQGEYLLDHDNWITQTLWTSATLGLFHKVGKVGDDLFVEGRTLHKLVKNISDPNGRAVAEKLVAKLHLEAALLFVLEAARSGNWKGDFNELSEDPDAKELFKAFFKTVLHPYVTATGLSIAGGATARLKSGGKHTNRRDAEKFQKAKDAKLVEGFEAKLKNAQKAIEKAELTASRRVRRAEKPGQEISREELLDLAEADPLTFDLLTQKMKSIPLSFKDFFKALKSLRSQGYKMDQISIAQAVLKIPEINNIASRENIDKVIDNMFVGIKDKSILALKGSLRAMLKPKTTLTTLFLLAFATPAEANGFLGSLPFLSKAFEVFSSSGSFFGVLEFLSMLALTGYHVLHRLPSMWDSLDSKDRYVRGVSYNKRFLLYFLRRLHFTSRGAVAADARKYAKGLAKGPLGFTDLPLDQLNYLLRNLPEGERVSLLVPRSIRTNMLDVITKLQEGDLVDVGSSETPYKDEGKKGPKKESKLSLRMNVLPEASHKKPKRRAHHQIQDKLISDYQKDVERAFNAFYGFCKFSKKRQSASERPEFNLEDIFDGSEPATPEALKAGRPNFDTIFKQKKFESNLPRKPDLGEFKESIEKKIAEATERIKRENPEELTKHEISEIENALKEKLDESIENLNKEYADRKKSLSKKLDESIENLNKEYEKKYNEIDEKYGDTISRERGKDKDAAEKQFNADKDAAEKQFNADKDAAEKQFNADKDAAEKQFNADKTAAEDAKRTEKSEELKRLIDSETESIINREKSAYEGKQQEYFESLEKLKREALVEFFEALENWSENGNKEFHDEYVNWINAKKSDFNTKVKEVNDWVEKLDDPYLAERDRLLFEFWEAVEGKKYLKDVKKHDFKRVHKDAETAFEWISCYVITAYLLYYWTTPYFGDEEEDKGDDDDNDNDSKEEPIELGDNLSTVRQKLNYNPEEDAELLKSSINSAYNTLAPLSKKEAIDLIIQYPDFLLGLSMYLLKTKEFKKADFIKLKKAGVKLDSIYFLLTAKASIQDMISFGYSKSQAKNILNVLPKKILIKAIKDTIENEKKFNSIDISITIASQITAKYLRKEDITVHDLIKIGFDTGALKTMGFNLVTTDEFD